MNNKIILIYNMYQKGGLVSVSFKVPNLFFFFLICKEPFLAKTHTHCTNYKEGGAINEQWTLNSWLLHIYLSIFIKRERVGGTKQKQYYTAKKIEIMKYVLSQLALCVNCQGKDVFWGGPRQDKVSIKRIINDSMCGT